MSFYMDEDATRLEDIRNRLYATDLIPTHKALLEGIDDAFRALERAGCVSTRELRVRLKNPKTIALLAERSGVDAEYLKLLRRVVDGFFPKPPNLRAFDWLDAEVIATLEKAGFKNAESLHIAARSGMEALCEKTGLSANDLKEPIALSDLSRVQWVSPAFARVLVAAGFEGAADLAEADAETLCEALERANAGGRFYKGKIGLRDIKRLIDAASYVPRH